MALNINWQGPTVRDIDTTSAMQGERETLSKAGQDVGTFVKNYRKYRADQKMKGLIKNYDTDKGQREQRMQQILAEIQRLEEANQKIRQQLAATNQTVRPQLDSGTDTMVFNFNPM